MEDRLIIARLAGLVIQSQTYIRGTLVNRNQEKDC